MGPRWCLDTKSDGSLKFSALGSAVRVDLKMLRRSLSFMLNPLDSIRSWLWEARLRPKKRQKISFISFGLVGVFL